MKKFERNSASFCDIVNDEVAAAASSDDEYMELIRWTAGIPPKSVMTEDEIRAWVREIHLRIKSFIRISKGTARWTANFTPPTSPYGINPTN